MRVKVCGIGTVRAARMAKREGADAIGVVVCSDSPRSVTLERARQILASVGPGMKTVLVTTAESPRLLSHIISLRPFAVQVNSSAKIPERCGVEVIRSMTPGMPLPPSCDAIVVDSSRGRGKRYDPEFALKVRKTASVPVILAGGLTPENVGEAVRTIRPFAVDVASGVERAPGITDRARLRAFMSAVREAEV